ncbi:hypothetical protein QQS21_008670 [Conoideocrella luteorostrata]|uniref:Uncharacterized protein n=1 Tax=Conoideocrella luteorostrata TaxID=1105319 RepID=A0AAJ0FR70_9HYPO|nr:hypothetical protein QQS21_008670 [Conoideocrella luteorostrata]
MSRTYDGWIFTKTRKFASDGRLQIGQVLGKPFQPESALMPRGPLPVPKDVIMDETEDKNVSISSESELKVLFRMWAELNPVPVTGEANIHVDHSDSASWHFDSLRSQQITPPLTYVQDSMEHDEVPHHLKKWRWDRRVFIVTGVTVAEGATTAKKNARAAGFKTLASGDSSGTGSTGLGMASEFETNKANEETTGESSNFVFAYSVNEVYYRNMAHAPFRKGEVQSVGDDNGTESRDEAPVTMIETVVVDDIDEEPYQGGDEDVDKEEACDVKV